MPAESRYLEPDEAPTRDAIDATTGLVLLEFGAPSCAYCHALAPRIAQGLAEHPEVKHIKVEDGPGRPLGRSFQVRLWPNLVLLKDGRLMRQLARPGYAQLDEALREFLAG